MGLISVSLCFKLGMARMHIWPVDVCSSIRLFLVAFFLPVRKLLIVSLLLDLSSSMSASGVYGLGLVS